MLSFANMPWLAAAAALIALASVGAAHSFERKADDMKIEDIKEDVAAAFNQRYGELFYQNPIDGQFLPIPTVTPDEFRLVNETSDTWHLLREPLVGMTVRATVLKDGSAIVFEKPEFAYE